MQQKTKTALFILIAGIACFCLGVGGLLGSLWSRASYQRSMSIKDDLLLTTVEFVFDNGLADDYYNVVKTFAAVRGLPEPPPPADWFGDDSGTVAPYDDEDDYPEPDPEPEYDESSIEVTASNALDIIHEALGTKLLDGHQVITFDPVGFAANKPHGTVGMVY